MKKHINQSLTRTLLVTIILCILLSASIQQGLARKTNAELSDTYKLIIITPQIFSRSLQSLVNHKNDIGMPTKLVTLDDVYTQIGSQGRDNPEKIKYYIKYAHETWGITYVMLVGDYRKMPVRYCYNADNNTGYPELRFLSELYYADLYDDKGNFSSWDTNQNGIYGEWTGAVAEDPDINLYPDVYVGRLACRTTIEVRTMVKKIITYETTTYDTDWFKKIVVVAGDTYPESINPNWTGYEGEENTLHVLANMSGFQPTKLWTSDGSLTGTDAVINAINQGCGFLYFDGHANPFRWSTHPPNDADTWIEGLSVLTMSQLQNKEKLPVCIVGGCHNLEFDTHLGKLSEDPWYYYTWIPECWGWKLTRKIGGGSIATIGCTGLGMTKEDKQSFSGAGDYLEPSFFYEYGVNGTHYLGETWGNTLTDYLKVYPINWTTPTRGDSSIDAKTVQQWALFGDPSLLIGGYPE
ncbi:MAG: C25 family cysteine peptidase [Methanobacteriota archaeon]